MNMSLLTFVLISLFDLKSFLILKTSISPVWSLLVYMLLNLYDWLFKSEGRGQPHKYLLFVAIFFFIIDNSYIIANSLPEIIQGPEIHAEEFLSGCKFYL